MPDDDISSQRGVDRNPERADPSPLTTQALLREVGHVRIELASAVDNIGTRLTAMDKAVELFKQDLVRFPTDVDKQVSNLKEKITVQIEGVKDLVFERFRTVEEKFASIVTRFQLNDLALNAALAAAKEAVGKQSESSNLAAAKAEAASTKQMDQVRDIVNTSIGGLNDKIDVGGNRMTTLESQVTGLLQTVAQLRATAPVAPVQPQSSTPIGLWIAAAAGLGLLLFIAVLELMQRIPPGIVK